MGRKTEIKTKETRRLIPNYVACIKPSPKVRPEGVPFARPA